MVPFISPVAFPDFIEAQSQKDNSPSKKELFIATLYLYRTTLHEIAMQSWAQFKDNMRLTSKRRQEAYESRRRREESQETSRLESEKRHLELYQDSAEGKIIASQASKFHIWEGDYTNRTHHLALPA